MILAGGQGTRLRPLTLARAKPVVPLLNRPFLAYQLALLREHGVTDVILACSYRVDDVRAALGEAEHLGVRLRYVIEAEPLGTGGGIRNAADLTAGTVFVLNGDVLSDVDLSAMRDFHEARGSRTTIYLTRVADPRAYGLVETAPDGRLLRFREKPGPDEVITTDTINAGVYLIDADLLGRMPRNQVVSIEREFFPALIADGIPAYGWLADTYWRDIGSPKAYREAQADLLLGRARMPLPPPGEARDGSWVDASATIDPGAHILAPAVIGPGVHVMTGARVGPLSVVGERSRIGEGARLEGAVLWEGVEVGPGAVLRECVVGADVQIGAQADIGPDVILESGAVIPGRTRLTAAPR
ncbi:MAG TPA: NDP-sugar synthase [Candidatus Limnocylindria bacterium]|nr:NDP-sugar synthase [Candidatus Limnocylindria bacterium]